MATTTAVITITTTEDIGTQLTNDIKAGQRPQFVLNNLGAFLSNCASASKFATVDVQINGGSAAVASGTVTIASGTGAIAAVVNGTTSTVTWTTSDTATATALAAAVAAANTGVATATSIAGVVTIKAAAKGTTGNTITLSATGTGATASGARLAGGTLATANSITF